MYVCMYVFLYVHVHYAGFHLEKWTRGGKIILRETLGGSKGTACNSIPSRGFLNFRPSEITFSEHLWFSNDMMR